MSLVSSAGALDALVAASGDTATRVEDLQFDLGEGPSWAASHSRRPVLAAGLTRGDGDDDDRGRWPELAAEALLGGIGAVFASPVQVDGLRGGVLDLSRDHAGAWAEAAWDDAAHAEALLYAAAATATALLLLRGRAYTEGRGAGGLAEDIVAGRIRLNRNT